MNAEHHPVIRSLRRSNVLQDRFIDHLAENGRPYRGVSLPDGVTRWRMGRCAEASTALEREHGWARVNGWVIVRSLVGHNRPYFHFWNTTDGTDAIDASLPNPPAHTYLGVRVTGDWDLDRMVIGEPQAFA